MEDEIKFTLILILILILPLLHFLYMIPIDMAKKKGISGIDLTIIMIIDIFSIFFGIGWIIALIMVYAKEAKTKDTINDSNTINDSDTINDNDKIDYNHNLDALE